MSEMTTTPREAGVAVEATSAPAAATELVATELVDTECGCRRNRLRRRCAPDHRSDRGDVPGWVLVTIMSAGMVMVLWQWAEPYFRSMLQQALDRAIGV